MNKTIAAPYRYLFFLGLFVLVVAAYFSLGHYHPDEHFQILEFCNYKLGQTPAADLAWEFKAQIRPALQPAIAFVCIKCWQLLGVQNPFILAFLLRLLTALLVWSIVVKMILLQLHDFSNQLTKKLFVGLHFLLWFMPLLLVRFSSENYASISLLLALYLIQKLTLNGRVKSVFNLLLIGFLLSLAFYFRFQMAFAIIGLGSWLLVFKKWNWKAWLVCIIGGFLGIGCNFLIDRWFYGTWVLTPYNYYIANIIEHRAEGWGVLPWWYYVAFVFLQAIPPISLCLLLLFVIGWKKSWKHFWVWILIPFLLAHFMVTHKEMRFLFPVVFAFIYLVTKGFDELIANDKWKRILKWVMPPIVGINLLVLMFRTCTPAQEAISYFQFFYQEAKKAPILVVTKKTTVYELVDVESHFYTSKNIQNKVLPSDSAITNFIEGSRLKTIYLFQRDVEVPATFRGYQTKQVYCLFPNWVLAFNPTNWQQRSHIWRVYQLTKTN
jgi:phosphatidylinositol glycan class B